jgi:predicted O-methyltransferase YrrM
MLEWITDFTYKIENRAARAGFVYKIASGYYREVIEKEAILANVTGHDHILCIGGGVCPFSAILFHQSTGARVTVIDNNPICIPRARQIITRLGIDAHVRVICQDGAGPDVSFAEYSVVHLALQVSPAEDVFLAVKRQIAPGTRVLVRRPKKQLDGMYSQFADSALACRPYVAHKSRNIGSTVLYIKPNGSGAIS